MGNHADIVLNFIIRYSKFEENWETYAKDTGLLPKEYSAICKTPGYKLKNKFHRACQLATHAEAEDVLAALGPCCVDNVDADDWTDEPVDIHEGEDWGSEDWTSDDNEETYDWTI